MAGGRASAADAAPKKGSVSVVVVVATGAEADDGTWTWFISRTYVFKCPSLRGSAVKRKETEADTMISFVKLHRSAMRCSSVRGVLASMLRV